MSHITTEQALQIPQQLKRQGSQTDSGLAHQANATEEKQNPRYLSDDAVTLLRLQSKQSVKKLEISSYKNELGPDNALVRETLRTKLAEYKLSPNTRLTVVKDAFGQIEIKGALLQSDIERISEDLNNSLPFKNAFKQLSQHQPTLNYVDNVVKLSSVYGVSNSLFNSLISDDSEFNKLDDISHRYQALKTNNDQVGIDHYQNFGSEQSFQYLLNG